MRWCGGQLGDLGEWDPAELIDHRMGVDPLAQFQGSLVLAPRQQARVPLTGGDVVRQGGVHARSQPSLALLCGA